MLRTSFLALVLTICGCTTPSKAQLPPGLEPYEYSIRGLNLGSLRYAVNLWLAVCEQRKCGTIHQYVISSGIDNIVSESGAYFYRYNLIDIYADSDLVAEILCHDSLPLGEPSKLQDCWYAFEHGELEKIDITTLRLPE